MTSFSDDEFESRLSTRFKLRSKTEHATEHVEASLGGGRSAADPTVDHLEWKMLEHIADYGYNGLPDEYRELLSLDGEECIVQSDL